MKHDQVGKAEAQLAAEEDEEDLDMTREINQYRGTREESPQKLAARLLHLLRGNL